MTIPAGWQNTITAQVGQFQANVDPLSLVPSRLDLSQVRLDIQQGLLDSGTQRSTPIRVTPDGVIWDGHHAVRLAAEQGTRVSVQVVKFKQTPTAASILDLPVG
jgi:hypothetical protein